MKIPSRIQEMTLLEGRHLSRQYRVAGRPPVWALRDVNCRIGTGSWSVITGPSGSGKSSLLSLLAALDRPTSGEVLVDGEELSRATDVELARYRRQRAGVVFQEYYLLHRLTAWENVAMPLLVTDLRYRQRQQRALELLALVGLEDRADHLPHQLSGGERQRVALARALVHEPDILFADEPTSSIDQEAAELVRELFGSLQDQGKTLVIVTHDPRMIEPADQNLRLESGSLRQ